MYVLGVDIGTTGTKAILVDETGACRGSSYKSYPLITLADGGIEQRAQDWWDTLVYTVREASAGVADKNEIAAMSLSTQGGSCVLLDEHDEPLGNACTWMDDRPKSVLDSLGSLDFRGSPGSLGSRGSLGSLDVIGEKRFYEMSGWRLSGAMMAARAVWYRRHQPEVWAAARRYLTTVDYINLRLTGRAVIDPTNAAMTQLFDIVSLDWDNEVLSAAGISRDMLPEIAASGEVIGTLLPGPARELGFPESVLVVSGAHDQYAAATGACATEPGDVVLSCGTAWVLLGISDRLEYDYLDYLGVGNHALKGLYGVLTSIPTAGAGLEWFRKNFAESELIDGALSRVAFKQIDDVAGKRVLQDGGLLFYPQFTGSGFPRWADNSKASFLGLSLEHDSYDMALVIMEGVAFEVALIIEAYAGKSIPVKSLKLLGGASKSRLWTDIVRNVTGLPIVRFSDADIACLGAAAFAASKCGIFGSVREAAEVIIKGKSEPLEAPQGALKEHYACKLAKYKELLPRVEELY